MLEPKDPIPKLYSNSIFWIDVDRIKPNPYQPRREFDEDRLRDLADSIRMYGVLQPLVVSRIEHDTEDGGMTTEYELIAGERRLRASKIAGLLQVPVIIRVGDDSMMKLEIAIIENLQREDLNSVERAKALQQLIEKFGFTHAEVGVKLGKSREYVSNTLRLLSMPPEMLEALCQGKINEGHSRPILMLSDRPEEQMVLFKEIVYKKITVREAERIARRIASDRIRKKSYIPDPEMVVLENQLQQALGTRVQIERRDIGGQIQIDFFSNEDLKIILDMIKENHGDIRRPEDAMNRYINAQELLAKGIPSNLMVPENIETVEIEKSVENEINLQDPVEVQIEKDIEKDFEENPKMLDDRSGEEIKKAEEEVDLYNIKNFSL